MKHCHCHQYQHPHRCRHHHLFFLGKKFEEEKIFMRCACMHIYMIMHACTGLSMMSIVKRWGWVPRKKFPCIAVGKVKNVFQLPKLPSLINTSHQNPILLPAMQSKMCTCILTSYIANSKPPLPSISTLDEIFFF